MSDDTSPPDWNAVYEQQVARLYNYFLYRVNQSTTAEDLTANTFKQAWASREQYDPQRGSVTAWLFGIARYVLVDYYRDQPPPMLSIDDAYRAASSDNTEHTVQKRLDADMLGRVSTMRLDVLRQQVSQHSPPNQTCSFHCIWLSSSLLAGSVPACS